MVADWNILQPYEIKFSMLHCMCQGASDNCLNYFTNVSLLLARVVMFVSRLPCRISPNICHCLHVAGGHGAFNFIDWPVKQCQWLFCRCLEIAECLNIFSSDFILSNSAIYNRCAASLYNMLSRCWSGRTWLCADRCSQSLDPLKQWATQAGWHVNSLTGIDGAVILSSLITLNSSLLKCWNHRFFHS